MFRNIKLDIKSIFIIILGGLLILSFIFRPKKDIDMYENQINVLHEENETLLNNNDSLSLVNMALNEEVDRIVIAIRDTEIKMDATNEKIKVLEDGKNKVSAHVNELDADGISESLTEYLNRRQ
jgi:hypothetical protein